MFWWIFNKTIKIILERVVASRMEIRQGSNQSFTIFTVPMKQMPINLVQSTSGCPNCSGSNIIINNSRRGSQLHQLEASKADPHLPSYSEVLNNTPQKFLSMP